MLIPLLISLAVVVGQKPACDMVLEQTKLDFLEEHEKVSYISKPWGMSIRGHSKGGKVIHSLILANRVPKLKPYGAIIHAGSCTVTHDIAKKLWGDTLEIFFVKTVVDRSKA